MKKRTAFITGIAGQDGALLAHFLVEKGYDVHGLARWDSYVDPLDGVVRLDEIGALHDRVTLHDGDVTDANNINHMIKAIQPDEIYNLAALSHVKVSFETPASVFDINTKGALNILEAVRVLGLEGATRIYQASSSEMFGSAPAPQNEATPFEPCSPYGVAKLAAFWLARTYRDSYGMYVSNGILFNHESALRGGNFVTQKVVRSVVEVERGGQNVLMLGNLDAVRDWGHAQDYVEGMWLMLQHKRSDDYVLATGVIHSVRDFVQRAFAQIGIRITWCGEGLAEIGVDQKTGRTLVAVDPAFFRPKEVHHLCGDARKAHEILGWMPKYSFDDLVSEMVNAARTRNWREPYAWPMNG